MRSHRAVFHPITGANFRKENAFPVVLPVHHGPFVERRGIEGLVEATEGRFSIVGIFAFRVGVMDDQTKAHSAARALLLSLTRTISGAGTKRQDN